MPRWLVPYCLLAGGCDAVTGLLLVVAPLPTLAAMGVAALPAEPIFLRWIGVFVAAVGVIYLLPLRRADDGWRRPRIEAALEATAAVRLMVAAFVGGAVALGALTVPWLTVAFTDLALGSLQVFILHRRGDAPAS